MPYASSSTAATTAPHRKNAALRTTSESPYQERTTQKDNLTLRFIWQGVDCLIRQSEAPAARWPLVSDRNKSKPEDIR